MKATEVNPIYIPAYHAERKKNFVGTQIQNMQLNKKVQLMKADC
jgi:hypothetical protein